MLEEVQQHVSLESGTNVSEPNEKLRTNGGESQFHEELPEGPALTSFRWAVLSSSLLLAFMQAALDSTITADVQPAIIDTFSDVSKLPWINVSYSLGMSSSCLLWGRLVHAFDKKNTILFARLLFAVGTATTAAAPSLDAFIVGKVIIGIGSSGTYISAISVITAYTSDHQRGQYFSYIGFMWGLGTILGPPIGGAFTVGPAGWRWGFYFNLILVGLTIPACIFILPFQKRTLPYPNIWHRTRSIDVMGAFLFASALSVGVTSLSIAGASHSWSEGITIGMFCADGCLWILFVGQQITALFTTKEGRILPCHVLQSWEMWILIIQLSCSISILFLTILYIPLYFQFVRNESALRSAIDLLPFLLTSVFAMLISGRLIDFGYYKVWFIAGSCLGLVMSVCLYKTDIDTVHGKIYCYQIIGGIGIGLYAMNAGPVMAAIVDKDHVTDAGTIFGCVDAICAAVSIGVANCIFVNRATTRIQTISPDTPRNKVQQAITGVGAPLTDQLPPSLQRAVLQAVLDAIKDVWIQMIATAALSLLLACLLRNRKLSQLRG